MGCFLGCFGSDQDRHRKKPKRKSPPRSPIQNRLDNGELKLLCQLKASPEADSVLLLAENRGTSEPEAVEKETEILCVNVKKKVTFDLNVTKYIEASAAISPILEADEEQGGEEEGSKLGEDGNVSPKQVAFPANHRYQNCVVSDDEEDEDDEEEVHGDGFEDLEEDELEDYGDGFEEDMPEESQESCFSLSLDAVQMFDVMPEKNKDDGSPGLVISSAGGARDRSQYVRSVLNPVENLSQWKEVKAKPSSTIKKSHKKENIDFEEDLDFPPFSPEEPTFKSPKQSMNVPSTPTPPKPAVAVDASLSTWLSSPSQDTRTSSASVSRTSYSPSRFDDRPILGVLTVEQIKSSASSSPRRSPSKSPDDIPIVGTVGRYWIHQPERAGMNGIPNTTSKYREVGSLEKSRLGLRF